MGYVNPSSEPEPRGFADQFEHDGHGWLFRRFHRARPVRVTPDEMDQCISFYERWSGRWTVAVAGAWIGGVILWSYFGPQEGIWVDRRFHGLGTAVAVMIGWMGRQWIWRRATDRFTRRVPVGLGQSWIEDRRSQASERGWTELFGPILLFGAGAYLLWPLEQASGFDIALAAVAGGAALLDLSLKFRDRFL